MKKTFKKNRVCALEGGKGLDYYMYTNALVNSGMDVRVINNLYKNPSKLNKLNTLKPEYLFIGTTGMRAEHRESLVAAFMSSGYIPEKVLFAGESSAMAYLDVARSLKKKYGTKFFFSPIFPIGPTESVEDREISWI